MTFEEWFHKHCEPIDLQIEQAIKNDEIIDMSAKTYRDDLKEAFDAGFKAGQDDHCIMRTQAQRIAELEALYKKALEDVVKLSDENKGAKKIIKGLLEIYCVYPQGVEPALITKAKQFIKE